MDVENETYTFNNLAIAKLVSEKNNYTLKIKSNVIIRLSADYFKN